MATVLVVDDSAVHRRLAGGLLQKRRGLKPGDGQVELTAVYAMNGQEALSMIEQQTPDVVVTDLQMPEMDGLELVEAIKRDHPSLPVVLMTAHGSEEIAVQALQRGAASYVPKQHLARDLLPTVQDLLEMVQTHRYQQRLLGFLTHQEANFVLENDPALVPPLTGYLENITRPMNLGDENEFMRIAVALREAVINAMYHGNLEVSSTLRLDDDLAYFELADQRRSEEPYCSRRVSVHLDASRSEVVYVIADEGPGFDPLLLPDPTDPANLEKPSGRGLFLIRTFMDHVEYNSKGNQITLVKRRA